MCRLAYRRTFYLWYNILLSRIRITAKAVQVVNGALADHGLPPKLPVVNDFDHQWRHVQFFLGQELGITKTGVLFFFSRSDRDSFACQFSRDQPRFFVPYKYNPRDLPLSTPVPGVHGSCPELRASSFSWALGDQILPLLSLSAWP